MDMNIDKLFEPLREHQIKPSEKAWEKLAKKLPAQRKKPKIWRWFGLAFLLLGVAGFMFEKQEKNTAFYMPTVSKNTVFEKKEISKKSSFEETNFEKTANFAQKQDFEKNKRSEKLLLEENKAENKGIVSEKNSTALNELPRIYPKILDVQTVEVLPEKNIVIEIIIKRGGEQPENHLDTFQKTDTTKTQFGRILKQLSHLKNGEKVNFDQFRRYPTKN